MIGLDTNVVVRIMTGDDDRQVAKIRAFLDGRSADDPAYVSSVVLAETIWVLESRLGYSREAVLTGLERLLTSNELQIEHGERLSDLLQERHGNRIDIADHLVAWSSQAAGCSATVTFDRRAARNIPGMELLS